LTASVSLHIFHETDGGKMV